MKNNQQTDRLMISDLTVWEDLDEEQQAQVQGGFNLTLGIPGIFDVNIGVGEDGVSVGINTGSQDS